MFLVLGSVFGFMVPNLRAQGNDDALIARVGEYVERYYTRAQTLVVTEAVSVEPITRRLKTDGPARLVVNEMRIEWDAEVGTQPREVRNLMDANGRRFGPSGQSDCLDQRSVTFGPLGFLLPANRARFRFTVRRVETINGVRMRRIDYETKQPEPPAVRWTGKCGWVDSFGRTRGSVWVDPVTAEVLRFDEHLAGRVKLPGPAGDANAPTFVAERADTVIDYRKFGFEDPSETLLLPSRVESVTFIENSAAPRVRVVRTFTNYRRFLTEGRVLPVLKGEP